MYQQFSRFCPLFANIIDQCARLLLSQARQQWSAPVLVLLKTSEEPSTSTTCSSARSAAQLVLNVCNRGRLEGARDLRSN